MTECDSLEGTREQNYDIARKDEGIGLEELLNKPLDEYINRLNTFKCTVWDALRKPSSESLAQAGFYFTGKGDHVKCFKCQLTLHDWKKNDIPLEDHKSQRAECPFICDGLVSVQPLEMERSSECNPVTQTQGNRMEEEHYRQLTFDVDTWRQKNINISPQKFAKAGFFYIGEEDKVKCYVCCNVFCNWGDGDDPAVQHKVQAPCCEFVNTTLQSINVTDIESSGYLTHSSVSLGTAGPAYAYTAQGNPVEGASDDSGRHGTSMLS